MNAGAAIDVRREVQGAAVSRSSVDSPELAMPKKDTTPVPDRMRITRQFNINSLLIDGAMRPWNGEFEQIFSPLSVIGDKQLIGRYPMMTGKEALEAVESSAKAYDSGLGAWPQAAPLKRIEAVQRFIAGLRENRDEIAKALVWEIAKTEADAKKEVDRTIEYLTNTINEFRTLLSEQAAPEMKVGLEVERTLAPRGVVLCMGPSNYPVNESLTILIPALLMGNTAVVKTPKLGTAAFEPMVKLFRECFPAGVVNMVTGDGIETITPIMKSGLVDSLAFIGGIRAAKAIINAHPAPYRLRVVLGLGAKNAGVITKDADIDHAVKQCVTGSLSYNGQRCTALKILFVHESVADNFVPKFVAAVEKLKLGNPWEEGVSITALAEPGKVKYMDDYVVDATAHGARVVNLNGGTSRENLYTPAVLYPVNLDSRIATEEQFGPVVPIVVYKDEKEVIDWQKNSPFAQQSSVFTTDRLKHASLITAMRALTDRVNINRQCERGPDDLAFSGHKDSGFGVLSLRQALLEFSVPRLLARDSVHT